MTDEEIVALLRERNHTPHVLDTEVSAYRLGWEARGKDEKDTVRLDLLQRRILALDTEWGERKETVLIIRWDDTPVSGSLRETIDRAMLAAKGKP